MAQLLNTIIDGNLTKKNGDSDVFNYTYVGAIDGRHILMTHKDGSSATGQLVASPISCDSYSNVSINGDTYIMNSRALYKSITDGIRTNHYLYTYAAGSLNQYEIPMYNGDGELVESPISYIRLSQRKWRRSRHYSN